MQDRQADWSTFQEEGEKKKTPVRKVAPARTADWSSFQEEGAAAPTPTPTPTHKSILDDPKMKADLLRYIRGDKPAPPPKPYDPKEPLEPIVITGRRPAYKRPKPRISNERIILDPVTGKPLGPPPLEQPGWGEQYANLLMRPVGEALPQTAEAAGEAVDALAYGLNRLGGLSPEESQRQQTKLTPYIKKVTSPIRSFVRGATPLDPAKEGYASTEAVGALGSALSFLIPGKAAKALGIPTKVVMGTMGAGLNISQVLEEADQLKASPDKRAMLTFLAGATGLTEIVGLGDIIDKFGMGQLFRDRIRDVLKDGGQEALQEYLNNVSMVITNTDPNRPLDRNVLKSAILGTFASSTIQGLSAGASAVDTKLDEIQNKLIEEAYDDARKAMKLKSEGPATIPPPPPDVSEEGLASRDVPEQVEDLKVRLREVKIFKTQLSRMAEETRSRTILTSEVMAAPEYEEFYNKWFTEGPGTGLDPNKQTLQAKAEKFALKETKALLRAKQLENINLMLSDYLKDEALLRKRLDEEFGLGDMTFDILPGLTEGQAPTLLVPPWVLAKGMGYPEGRLGGASVHLTDLHRFIRRMEKGAPDLAHSLAATDAINQVRDMAVAEGLDNVLVVDSMAPQDVLGIIIPHETFHAGQQEMAKWITKHGKTGLYVGELADIIDHNWAKNDPDIRRLLDEDPNFKAMMVGQANGVITPEAMAAIELPAYAAAGQWNLFFSTPDDAKTFLRRYFRYIIDTHGMGALERLERTAKLRPEMKNFVEEARLDYEQWQSEQASKPKPKGRRKSGDTGTSTPRKPRGRPKLGTVVGRGGLADESYDPGIEERPTAEVPIRTDKTGLGEDEYGDQLSRSNIEPYLGGVQVPSMLSIVEKPDDVRVGERVKIRNYKSPARVTHVFEDGVEVEFEDGGVDEFYFNQIIKKLPPKDKAQKMPESTDANRQAVKDAPVVVEPVDTGQGHLFPEGQGRKKVAQPPMPPGQENLFGGKDMPPLMEERVSNVYNRAVDQAFAALLEANGVRFDPTRRVFYQVANALMEGRISSKAFDEVLAENGLTMEQFKDAYLATATESGRTLQELSRIKMRWLKMMKKNPALEEKLFTQRELFESLLEDMNNTMLGRSLFQRGTTIIRMLMLSDLQTAAINAIVTAGRIPLVVATQGAGAWMQNMALGKAQGMSFAKRMEKANRAAWDWMKVGAEVWLQMKPSEIVHALKKDGGRYQYYEDVITQLTESFPDLYHRLIAPGIGYETMPQMQDQLNIAKERILKMRTADVRFKSVEELKVYEKRFNSNMKGIGKLLRGPEWLLDKIMTPMRWQELFFRRPIFVAHLKQSLMDRGMDLDALISSGDATAIPDEVLEASIDEALDFTYAYMPHKGGPGFENAAHTLIKWINSLGAISALVGVAFPRAVYNGLKFTYEYSPIGAAPGLYKMYKQEKIVDPLTGKPKIINTMEKKDYERIAKGMAGTVMYGAAVLMYASVVGDEWWKIKTGRKDADGNPVYLDIRRYQPFSTFMRIVDLTARVMDGRVGDLQFGKELQETLTGLRDFPGALDMVSALVDMWEDDQTAQLDRTTTSLGMGFSFVTRPFINLRHAVAMFSEEENKQRDLKGTGILGPMMDNVPWLRRLLAEKKSMTQKGPELEADDDFLTTALGMFPGVKLVEGENFAGREWRRLGLLNRRFLDPDPDPAINRAQNEYFRKLIDPLAKSLEKSASYQRASDAKKAALWEIFVMGDEGVAAQAREMGLLANPKEAQRRELIQGTEMGPLLRKATGITESLKKE